MNDTQQPTEELRKEATDVLAMLENGTNQTWRVKRLRAAAVIRALLAAQPAQEPAVCHWSQEEDSDTWGTQCGRYFTINDGSPSDNEMRFCCFCGKPLVEIRFEDEHEDTTKPALPEPQGMSWEYNQYGHGEYQPNGCFTADQMEAYAQAAIDAALESPTRPRQRCRPAAEDGSGRWRRRCRSGSISRRLRRHG